MKLQRTFAGAACIVGLTLLAAPARPAAAAVEDSALLAAAKRGDHEAIGALIAQGADVAAAQPDGTTALHWAAHRGDLRSVQALLDAGADAAAASRYGIAPLWLAAEDGHASVVAALLEAGADPNTARGESGETVLMIAARGGHAGVLRRLLAHGAEVNRQEAVRQQSALMWAAAERHPEAVQVLAGAGADLEARSSTGITPLLFAVRAGDIATTGALLDAGADPAATVPVQEHHFDGWALRGGADPAAIAPDGTTALTLAIINAHWELAAYLLERGADPNGNDSVHGRPLQALAFVRRAVNRGLSPVIPRRETGNISSLELAEVLIEHGAVVDDPIDWRNPLHQPPHMSMPWFVTMSYVGATPFLLAAKRADVELMTLLLEHGADPMRATAQGVTPLLAAAGVGYSTGESPETDAEALEAVELLYERGANVADVVPPAPEPSEASGPASYFGRDLPGSSAVHGAVQREAPDLLAWLIERGAPLDERNGLGKTAIELVYGVGLGTSRVVREQMGEALAAAMKAQGLPVPELAIVDTYQR